MAELTVTLQSLRRDIARELRMDFARRFSSGYVSAAPGCTTSKFISTSFTQEDNFWAAAWIYHVERQACSLITESITKDTSVLLEIPVSNAPLSGDALEIHNMWNAYDIHNAINRVVGMVNRIFIDSQDDETYVISENTLKYSLASLPQKPWVIAKVSIEQATNVKRGIVQSATATSITVENSSILSGVNSNYKISIYSGTGVGQLRSISSVVGAQVNTAAWGTVPAVGDKYAIWNPIQQVYDWIPTNEWYPDAKEYPDYLNLRLLYTQNYGMRMRISYLAVPSTLSAETDTTIIPKEYIIPKVCSILHGQALNNTKADRSSHSAEFQRYDAIAEGYLSRNTPHKPDMMIKATQASSFYDENDPLGWSSWNN